MLNRPHQSHFQFRRHLGLVLLVATIATFAAACAATPNQESTGGYFDDATITAKVKSDLAADPNTSAREIHVNTYKGVVDLSGFVNAPSEIPEARLVASKVPGVTAVHDNLIVKQAVAPATTTERRTDVE
jgi:osmotically-inducible protein OsmY